MASEWLKYGGTAAGGVAVGGTFPLFLFDKIGVAHLLENGSAGTFTTAVYAFTVFAMMSFLILGIGSFLAHDNTPKVRRNPLFYLVVAAFALAFLMGFAYFIYSAAIRPGITIKVAFDRYEQDVAAFPRFPLKPYFLDQKKRTFNAQEETGVMLTGEIPIRFGIDNLHELENDYGKLQDEASSHFFDNRTMAEICSEKKFSANPICSQWGGARAER